MLHWIMAAQVWNSQTRLTPNHRIRTAAQCRHRRPSHLGAYPLSRPAACRSEIISDLLWTRVQKSKSSAVVSPVEQGLALLSAAGEVAGGAVFSNLRRVALHGLPAADLAGVFFRHAPAHVVAAIPLKPAARVVAGRAALHAVRMSVTKTTRWSPWNTRMTLPSFIAAPRVSLGI